VVISNGCVLIISEDVIELPYSLVLCVSPAPAVVTDVMYRGDSMRD
jgi:hypothetical protein